MEMPESKNQEGGPLQADVAGKGQRRPAARGRPKPILQSVFSDLATVVGALGPISAWVGGSLLISAFGYLSKHLYLSGYGIRYAQFAKADDFLLDATEAFAFILPAAIASVLAGALVFPVARRLGPILAAKLRAVPGLTRFVFLLVGWHAQSWLIKAALFLLRKIDDERHPAWRQQLSKKNNSLRDARPSRPAEVRSRGPLPKTYASLIVLAALCTIMTLDLLGRYGASRLDRFVGRPFCVFAPSLRECVVNDIDAALHFLGTKSRDWMLSPTPRPVRLVGVDDNLPPSLRVSWKRGASDKCAVDLQLIDRNVSYLFLRARQDHGCSQADEQNDAVVVAAESVRGVSFADAVDDPATEKSTEDENKVQFEAAALKLAASLKETAGEFAKAVVAETELGESTGEAIVALHKAISSMPRTLKAEGSLSLSPGPIDLKLEPSSVHEIVDFFAAAQRAERQLRSEIEQDSRKFQDCLEQRRLGRNMLQRVRGSVPAALLDCSKQVNVATKASKQSPAVTQGEKNVEGVPDQSVDSLKRDEPRTSSGS